MFRMSKSTVLIVSVLFALVLSGCAQVAASSASAPAAESAPEAVTEYVNAEALVDTDWVLEHLDDENVKLIEISTNADDYAAGHLPGALHIHGVEELTNPDDVTRGQILAQDALSELLSRNGVSQDDTLVFHDRSNNLWASRAYWALKYYQHDDVRLYNGGVTRWLADGQELSTDAVAVEPSEYVAGEADAALRTTTEYVVEKLEDDNALLCDTRSPDEFAGTDVRAARGGHVPGAINVEWVHAVNADGTFKDAESLYELYTKAGFTPDKEIITYCQTGVRGAHTWFVLSELLGYPDVRNYDGSWEEYGNQEDTPIQS
jgi:thiosulfate/3-mercaptopyruvate sulfurtransferase